MIPNKRSLVRRQSLKILDASSKIIQIRNPGLEIESKHQNKDFRRKLLQIELQDDMHQRLFHDVIPNKISILILVKSFEDFGEKFQSYRDSKFRKSNRNFNSEFEGHVMIK